MLSFAPRPLQTVTVAHVGNESAVRDALRRVYASYRSACIRRSRLVNWFQLANVRLTRFPLKTLAPR
jgi:hypothetical protein